MEENIEENIKQLEQTQSLNLTELEKGDFEFCEEDIEVIIDPNKEIEKKNYYNGKLADSGICMGA